MGAALAAIVLILTVGLVNEYVIKPRTVLASVDGTVIRRRDYWRARGVDLANQVDQFSRIAGLVGGEQASQYQQQAAVAQSELNGLWGSTDTNDEFLQRMVDDQVYLKNLDSLGLEVTEQDVETWELAQFAPEGVPLVEPTATPTLIPERAEWATATAAANATASAAAVAPTAPAGVAEPALPLPPPTVPPTAGSEGVAADGPATTVSPTVGAPGASPTVPAESPTPNAEQALATAEAGRATYRDDVFDRARINESQYRAWVARPAVARQKVEEAIAVQVGQSQPQVRAHHILVGTQELAASLRAQLDQGANFEELARGNSTDTGTAPNGGDLGWAAREQYVAPFADAAFALQPGQISQPVQTEFGWHLIRVDEVDPDRALTTEQIEQTTSARVERWLADRRAESNIESDVDPTPTTAPAAFEPPADAPPAPTPAPTTPPPTDGQGQPATLVPLPPAPPGG